MRAKGQTRSTRKFWWDREPPVDAHALRAVIFDADSALADLERDGHRVAVNAAFAEHDEPVGRSVEEYGRLLQIPDGDSEPRSGLIDLVMSLFVAGIWVGVVSTRRRACVETLVRQLVGDGLVETIVTVDDLPEADSPGCDAELYRLALWELGITPQGALTFTGSRRGLRAAVAAGVPVHLRHGYDGLLAGDCEHLHRRWWIRQQRRGVA